MGKLSDFPLADYVNRGFKTLVETGSGTGTGIDNARGFGFDRILSCEIIESQARLLRARYRNDPRIVIYHQESPSFLDDLFTHVLSPDDRCVIFSDAHFPASDIHGIPYDSEPDLAKRLPLEGELQALLRHSRAHDIILIDDLRIWEKCPMQGGDLEACGLGHITRYDAPDFLAPWRETHHVEKRYVDTGYIVMIPKSL